MSTELEVAPVPNGAAKAEKPKPRRPVEQQPSGRKQIIDADDRAMLEALAHSTGIPENVIMKHAVAWARSELLDGVKVKKIKDEANGG
jgi:hypothetical protein